MGTQWPKKSFERELEDATLLNVRLVQKFCLSGMSEATRYFIGSVC